MDVQVTGTLTGTVQAPPSKSQAHRLLLAAFLGGSPSVVENVSSSQDMEATLSACAALGGKFVRENSRLRFLGRENVSSGEIFCRESGSTLRFLIPVAAALGGEFVFTGAGRLPQRPIAPLVEALSGKGAAFSGTKLPLTVSGKLRAGEIILDPSESSQYLTGLLFALPILEGESRIRLTKPITSRPYVDMTLQVLRQAGILLKEMPDGFLIPGGQRPALGTVTVEGDWSNSAFWLAAGALCGEVHCHGLRHDSLQGDRAILPLLERFGACVERKEREIIVKPSPLSRLEIDAGDIPDLVPVLAVTAACAEGSTRIVNAGRLRLKESDRLSAVAQNLRAIGGRAKETPDGLIIEGTSLSGGTVDCFGDHRIAMAFAVASLACKEPVTLLGAECVNKSYPEFFDDFQSLGGIVHVL